MIEFFKALNTYFEAEPHNAFYTAIGGRFSYGESEQDGDSPYAVYFGMPSSNDDTFTETIDDSSFQVNIYSSKKSATEAMQLLRLCLDLFDGQTITVPGYRDVTIIRIMWTPPWKDGKSWVSSVEFTTLLQED